jgi:hypothetical protein
LNPDLLLLMLRRLLSVQLTEAVNPKVNSVAPEAIGLPDTSRPVLELSSTMSSPIHSITLPEAAE